MGDESGEGRLGRHSFVAGSGECRIVELGGWI